MVLPMVLLVVLLMMLLVVLPVVLPVVLLKRLWVTGPEWVRQSGSRFKGHQCSVTTCCVTLQRPYPTHTPEWHDRSTPKTCGVPQGNGFSPWSGKSLSTFPAHVDVMQASECLSAPAAQLHVHF